MTYVVTEDCIKCKFTDCVEVCPVDCFYEGENMLVINPDECIDCGVCEPECPAEAILPDSDSGAEKWIDFDFFGHQLVLHEKEKSDNSGEQIINEVDGQNVPVPHFGVVLAWKDWITLSEKLKVKNINFTIEPYIRFEGKVGEQATMFFLDPENNALEFKAFKNTDQLFEK